MSVMIKGMEMPSRCEECFGYDEMGERSVCALTYTAVLGRGKARLNNCPLEEVKDLVISLRPKKVKPRRVR